MNHSRRSVIVAGCLATAPGRPPAAGSSADPVRQPAPGPVEVDLSDLAPEQLKRVDWKGKPVWILRRSPEMVRQLESPELLSRLANPTPAPAAGHTSDTGSPPRYADNRLRSIRPDIFVGIALCPHAGCVPVARLKAGPNPAHPDNWPGGFACQCHFATFDLAGRVFKDKPTRDNIEVPRHMFLGDSRIVIGKDHDGEA